MIDLFNNNCSAFFFRLDEVKRYHQNFSDVSNVRILCSTLLQYHGFYHYKEYLIKKDYAML